MTDTHPFEPALFRDAAIDPDTAARNAQMIELLTGQPEWWLSVPRLRGPPADEAKGPSRPP